MFIRHSQLDKFIKEPVSIAAGSFYFKDMSCETALLLRLILNNMLKHILALAIVAVSFPLSNAKAQAKDDDALPAPDLVREKLVKYVEIKKTISKEEADWQTEKELLSDLIKLREQEIEKESEIVAVAEKRVDTITKKKSAFAKEIKERSKWRKEFAKTVSSLEKSLIPNLGYLPAPVKKEVKDAIERLESDEPKTIDQLQARFRDVAAILNECTSFNKQIHTYSEIREADGEKLEVEVLYMGLSQAWYVDRTGKRAGIGRPTAEGWVWESKPKIASQIRKAINVQSKRETPAFAKLPIVNSEK